MDGIRGQLAQGPFNYSISDWERYCGPETGALVSNYQVRVCYDTRICTIQSKDTLYSHSICGVCSYKTSAKSSAARYDERQKAAGLQQCARYSRPTYQRVTFERGTFLRMRPEAVYLGKSGRSRPAPGMLQQAIYVHQSMLGPHQLHLACVLAYMSLTVKKDLKAM
jgi:hypothetical protein